MKRAEQIEQAAKRYVNDIVTPLPASLMTAFIKGAEYADEHPINYDGKAMLYILNKGHEQGYKDAINKACEWLKGNVWCEKEFFERFRKAMEENK